MRRKIRITLLAGIILTVGGYIVKVVADDQYKRMMDVKTVREASAVAMRKEYVKFDKTNHSYLDEMGQRIEKEPGDEQWRVYFTIIDFEGFDEETRNRLLQGEARRAEEGNLRFTALTKEDYETTDAGDSFTVNCQRFADERLMTWGALNHKKKR